MQRFSIYNTLKGSVNKTTCLLTEKCYKAAFKILILAPDFDSKESLNKLLWTYSKKQFIPHGSDIDPFPEKQPIYITNQLKNHNQASILIIISPSNLEDILNNANFIKSFQRIIVVSDEIAQIANAKKVYMNLLVSDKMVDCYQQEQNGSWKEAT